MNNPQKLLILNKKPQIELKKDSNSLFICKLIHPKTNELCSFIISKSSNDQSSYELYEIVTFGNQENSSLFIDNYVHSDVKIHICSVVDLRFFLISLANENRDEFKSIKDHLSSLIFGSKTRLIKLEKDDKLLYEMVTNIDINKNNLTDLFDLNDDKNEEISKNGQSIRFNQQKSLKWLKKKVIDLENYLKKIDATKFLSTSVGIQNKVNKSYTQTNESSVHKMEAFELVSQYLSKELSDLLRRELNFNSPLLDSNDNSVQKVKRTKSSIILD
jgi:hypothetical protein